MRGVVNCAAYVDGRRLADVDLADIGAVIGDDRFLWIGLHEPDEETLAHVQRAFGLHDLAVEDAHRAHQRPKVERYGESLFVVLRTAQLGPDGRGIEFGETHIFVGPRYVVSVRHGASLSYAEVRKRCEATPALLRRGPGFALYAIMDFVVDQYFPLVEQLEDALDTLEEDVFAGAFNRETTARIYRLKRTLLEVKRAVSPLVDMCNRLLRFDNGLVPEDVRPYLRDVYDHAVRINEMIDTQRELLTTALEANLSLVTVAQNESMKRLAGWAAIIGVPTMIAGIYGMNFRSMPELEWSFGYPMAMGIMLVVCLLLYLNFKRVDWL